MQSLEKLCFFMSTQDDASLFFLKLWPRIEANKNRLIAIAVLIAIAIFAGWIFAVQSQQKQIEAGEKLTQLTLTPNAAPAAYLKIADDYTGTKAGQRALLQAASELFASGKFSDAQTQFKKFLDEHSDSEFAASAALGVAASLDAQNKTDLAVTAYQAVLRNYPSDANAVNAAKMGLARIYETQGRFNDAIVYYQDVAQQSLISSLRQEAGLRLMDLKNKMAVAKPSPAPSIPPVPVAPIAPAK
jgi:predicted negative regulator of RcsB-dependent stress response